MLALAEPQEQSPQALGAEHIGGEQHPPSDAPGSCRGCLLYSTRTANTPGLLPLLPLLLLGVPRWLLLLLVPMLFVGLRVGGLSSHSSNTRLLM